MMEWLPLLIVFVVSAFLLVSVLLKPVIVRRRKDRPDGLSIISDPDNAAFDIVAVHGLGAHPEYTWTCKSTRGAGRVHLLRDFLREDYPRARILSFAYNSDWLMDAPTKTPQQIANVLVQQLAKHRSTRPYVPIVFIGHSFGGIFIKQALCHGKPEDGRQQTVDSTCGIIFLGTPHLGSSFGYAGSIVAYLTRFLGSNTGLLGYLSSHQTQLSELNEDFLGCMEQKEEEKGQKTKIVAFYETMPSYRLESLGWLSVGEIVDRDSASSCSCISDVISIDTDHSGLNKCNDKEDQLYRELKIQLDKLESLTTTGPALNPIQKAVKDSLTLCTVNSAAFDSYDNEENSGCYADTRRELLQEIYCWSNSDDYTQKHIFWLQGKAGTGKSTISHTVARHLSENHRLASSFFFKRGEANRSKARRLFTTLTVQLVEHFPEVAPFVKRVLDEKPDIAEKALGDQFEKLILEPLESLSRTDSMVKGKAPKTMTIVIDALDECDGDKDIKNVVYQLSRANHLTKVRLKFFVTSRPDFPIPNAFQGIQSNYRVYNLESVSVEEIERDIKSFLMYRLRNIKEQFEMEVPSDWPSAETIQTLVRRAVPLFVFAETACRFIENDRDGGGGPDHRLNMILTSGNHEDLENTYLSVLNQMVSTLETSKRSKAIKEFGLIVGSIICLTNPLSVTSLTRLLGEGMSKQVVKNRLRLLHSVLVVPSKESDPVRLFHESFRDFLTHPECEHEFKIEETNIHQMLTKKCLELLSNNNVLWEDICGLNAPGKGREDIDPLLIDRCLPSEIQYACFYWVHHLKKSGEKISDNHQAYTFLKSYLLHWLEALSLLGQLVESIRLIKDLQDIVDTEGSIQVTAFLFDIERFILSFRSIINEAPLQVYSSALVFAPKASLVRQQFEHVVPRWIVKPPLVDSDWSACLQTIEGDTWVTCVVFSADGHLASVDRSGSTKIWDPVTGVCLQTLMLDSSSRTTSIAFSPDGRLVSAISDDGKVMIWDLATGACLKTLKGHQLVAFSANGQQLILASPKPTIEIKFWDLEQNSYIKTQTVESDPSDRTNMALSADGRWFAWTKNKTIKTYNVLTDQVTPHLGDHKYTVRMLAFSTNGQRLASVSHDLVKIWDMATGQCLQNFDSNYEHWSCIAFLAQSQLFAIASLLKRSVTILDLTAGTFSQTIDVDTDYAIAFAFSADGRWLACGSRDGTIKIWDPTINCSPVLESHRAPVESLAFSSDGSLLISTSEEDGWDKTAAIWDTGTGTCLATLEELEVIAFHNQLLAVAGRGNIVHILNRATGDCTQTKEDHTDTIRTVAFSTAEQQFISASDDQTIKLWNIDTGKCIQTIQLQCRAESATISPDGKRVACALYNQVQIWDLSTGECLQRCMNHDRVDSVAFSSDGQRLASASDAQPFTVKFWSVETGKCLQTFASHESFRFPLNLSFVNLDLAYTVDTERPLEACFKNYHISPDGMWITKHGEKLLWLPPMYRLSSAAMSGSNVAIGCVSGSVIIIELIETDVRG